MKRIAILLFVLLPLLAQAQSSVDGYRESANAGNADAQYKLGNCYEYGFGVSEDYKVAFEWYKKAADQGQNEAQWRLGYLYSKGYGVKKDHEMAVKYFTLSIKNGKHFVGSYLAPYYKDGIVVQQDYKEAARLYRMGGDDDKAKECEQKYAENQGIDPSLIVYKNQLQLYEEAALKGDAAAADSLANCYFAGIYTKRDHSIANKWYLYAAERGNAHSQYIIGKNYFYGRDFEKDMSKAVLWLKKSAEQNNGDAAYLMGCYYDNSFKNYKDAFRWYLNAVNLGNEDALLNVALAYEFGNGTERDLDRAMYYYNIRNDKNGIARCQYAKESESHTSDINPKRSIFADIMIFLGNAAQAVSQSMNNTQTGNYNDSYQQGTSYSEGGLSPADCRSAYTRWERAAEAILSSFNRLSKNEQHIRLAEYSSQLEECQNHMRELRRKSAAAGVNMGAGFYETYILRPDK